MKEHHNINFKLFCQRKGFNLEKWIKNNPELTFKDLKESLLNIKVMPPNINLFNDLKEKNAIAVKENLPIKEEIKQEKTVKRRRRRKTTKNEN